MAKRMERITRGRKLTAEEASRLKRERRQLQREIPPAAKPKLKPTKEGIGARIRKARTDQGLTWYALARAAGIPNPATIRDIECGRDAKLSNLEAIAKALGLKLDLVEHSR